MVKNAHISYLVCASIFFKHNFYIILTALYNEYHNLVPQPFLSHNWCEKVIADLPFCLRLLLKLSLPRRNKQLVPNHTKITEVVDDQIFGF